MSTAASLLVLALAGLLLVTSSAAHSLDKCRGDTISVVGYTCADAGCCMPGQLYQTYWCSPPVSGHTSAIMTLRDFDSAGAGPWSQQCAGAAVPNNGTERVVALSTGWYDKGRRCHERIRIHAKGKSVLAEVVAECDSLHGCDGERGYQPPCRPNIVGASQAVWDALGFTGDEVGEYPITWSESDA